MFRRFGSRIAIASALMLAVIGTLAAASPAQAQAISVGPHQTFVGLVNGNVTPSVIQVTCTPVGTVGHPAPGQTVEVITPAVNANAGNTGDLAVEIDATLLLPTSPLPAPQGIPIATFTQYFLKLPIPTSITVPCGGRGVLSFSPYPLDSGTPSNVPVTFVSPVVTPGGGSSAPRA